MSASPKPLNYAQPAAGQRQINWQRTLIVACIVSVIMAGWNWGPRIGRRLEILWAQKSCLQNTASTDSLIYDASAKGPYLSSQSRTSFYTAIGLAPSASCGTVFMHELRRPDGMTRLVFIDVVEVSDIYPYPRRRVVNTVNLSVHVFRTGTLFSDPAEVTRPAVDLHRTDFDPMSARVFAAQLDPLNPSHFMIRYTSSLDSGIIDGYLHSDDSVTLEVRRPESAGH